MSGRFNVGERQTITYTHMQMLQLNKPPFLEKSDENNSLLSFCYLPHLYSKRFPAVFLELHHHTLH